MTKIEIPTYTLNDGNKMPGIGLGLVHQFRSLTVAVTYTNAIRLCGLDVGWESLEGRKKLLQ
jgi:hypothetical protein